MSATSNKPKQAIDKYIKYSGMAFELLGALLLGYWAGSKLDAWAGNQKPLAALACMLLAMLAAFYHVYKSLMRDSS